jgi:hypothetical protein
MENHHFSWVNPLEITISNSFLYVYQRVPQNIGRIIGSHVFGCQDFRSRRIQALLFGTINILGTPGTDGWKTSYWPGIFAAWIIWGGIPWYYIILLYIILYYITLYIIYYILYIIYYILYIIYYILYYIIFYIILYFIIYYILYYIILYNIILYHIYIYIFCILHTHIIHYFRMKSSLTFPKKME